jgi:hypothetical protein
VISRLKNEVAMKKPALSSILVATLVLVVGVASEAQQPTKVPRIGYLLGGGRSSANPRIEAFRQGLRELGYAEFNLRLNLIFPLD